MSSFCNLHFEISDLRSDISPGSKRMPPAFGRSLALPRGSVGFLLGGSLALPLHAHPTLRVVRACHPTAWILRVGMAFPRGSVGFLLGGSLALPLHAHPTLCVVRACHPTAAVYVALGNSARTAGLGLATTWAAISLPSSSTLALPASTAEATAERSPRIMTVM